ncbi:MAG: hypothetical protein OEX22_08510 [Cyclobacteriaceae bacterium]|nr:hypothetical protein [Cyclobacteriaceae bacterium]
MSDEQADEVFLKRNKKRIWPISEKFIEMKDAEIKVGVNIEVEKDTMVELELWDYDTWSPNDKLGVFKMLVDQRGGAFTTDLIGESGVGAKYSLEWEVV